MFQSLFPSPIWDNTFHTLFMFQFIFNGHVLFRIASTVRVYVAPMYSFIHSLLLSIYVVNEWIWVCTYDYQCVHFHLLARSLTYTHSHEFMTLSQFLNVQHLRYSIQMFHGYVFVLFFTPINCLLCRYAYWNVCWFLFTIFMFCLDFPSFLIPFFAFQLHMSNQHSFESIAHKPSYV